MEGVGFPGRHWVVEQSLLLVSKQFQLLHRHPKDKNTCIIYYGLNIVPRAIFNIHCANCQYY